MNKYEVVIHGQIHTLYNSQEFTKEQLESMVNRAISELKWNGIKRTYGNEVNYLNDHFGFYDEKGRVK